MALSALASVQRVALTAAGDSAWSGRATFEGLAERWLLGTTAPPASLALRFASPTAFRSREGAHVALPLPELVFGSLLDRLCGVFGPLRGAYRERCAKALRAMTTDLTKEKLA